MTPAPPTVSTLADLPDDARAWCYVTADPMGDDGVRRLADGLDAFFDGWRSHGRIVHGAAAVLERQVVVVAAVLAQGDISGCGIDQHVRVLDALFDEIGARHAGTLDVAWRDPDGALHVTSRAGFRAAGDAARRLPRDARTLGEIRHSGAIDIG